MPGQQTDLTIDDVLDDPMILALRRADRVDAKAFEALLRSSANKIGARTRSEVADTAPPDAQTRNRQAECERFMPAHICRRMLDGARPHEHGRGVSRAW